MTDPQLSIGHSLVAYDFECCGLVVAQVSEYIERI